MTHSRRVPFSSTVQLSLEIDGKSFPVAKSAPHRIALVTPTDHCSGPAVLKTVIDGRVHMRHVILPEGGSADSCFVRVESATASPLNA
ncbi:MAG: hypothetical protein AB7I48_11735 [Planctomycetaceae bacterium]